MEAQSRDAFVVLSSRTQFGERSIKMFGSRVWNLNQDFMRKFGSFDTFGEHYWLLHGDCSFSDIHVRFVTASKSAKYANCTV